VRRAPVEDRLCRPRPRLPAAAAPLSRAISTVCSAAAFLASSSQGLTLAPVAPQLLGTRVVGRHLATLSSAENRPTLCVRDLTLRVPPTTLPGAVPPFTGTPYCAASPSPCY
jgi:hypothetical protein